MIDLVDPAPDECSRCHFGVERIGKHERPCRLCENGRHEWPGFAGIPARYRYASPDDFADLGDDIKLWRFRPDPDSRPASAGWYLWGEPGVGKTHLAAALFNASRGELLLRPVWSNVADLLAKVKASFDGEAAGRELLARLLSADAVVLDDIGVERTTDWSEAELGGLIDRLYSDDRALVVTSNLPPSELARRYGLRIAGRLLEMCTPRQVRGGDRRLPAAKRPS